MAVGDLTVTLVGRYRTIELLVTGYDLENSGAATAKDDTTTFHIVPEANGMTFSLIKVVRAAA